MKAVRSCVSCSVLLPVGADCESAFGTLVFCRRCADFEREQDAFDCADPDCGICGNDGSPIIEVVK